MAEHQQPELTTLAALTPDPRNARRRTPRSANRIARSLEKLGAARSIVIDEDGRILAGNGTVEAAAEVGIERVQVVECDGSTLIAVRRRGLSEAEKVELAIADNRTAELSEWDDEVLGQLADEYDLSDWFMPAELDEVLDGANDPAFEEETEQPMDADRYALAIVLPYSDYQRWKAFKAEVGLSKDVSAFLKMLEDATRGE